MNWFLWKVALFGHYLSKDMPIKLYLLSRIFQGDLYFFFFLFACLKALPATDFSCFLGKSFFNNLAALLATFLLVTAIVFLLIYYLNFTSIDQFTGSCFLNYLTAFSIISSILFLSASIFFFISSCLSNSVFISKTILCCFSKEISIIGNS